MFVMTSWASQQVTKTESDEATSDLTISNDSESRKAKKKSINKGKNIGMKKVDRFLLTFILVLVFLSLHPL